MTPPEAWPPPQEGQAWPSSSYSWEPWPPAEDPGDREGFAVASLILGIVPCLGGILGIAFGITALIRIAKSRRKGRVMAIWGISLGGLWFFALVGLGVFLGLRGEGIRNGAETGSIALGDLRAGDCLASLPRSGQSRLDVVDCYDPHAAQVFAVPNLGSGAFPGSSQAKREAVAACAIALPAFVGVAPGKPTGYEVLYLSPSSLQWRLGKRDAVCVLHDASGKTLTASAEGGGAALDGLFPSPSPTRVIPPGQTSGDVLSRDLRVGDCLASTTVGEHIVTVPLVPCAGKHKAEVFAAKDLSATAFPGTRDARRLAAGYCSKVLAAYVGKAAESRYDVYYLYPTADGWAQGDHGITCLLAGLNDRVLVGSARHR